MLQNLQKFIMDDYYFINKLFFSQSSVNDKIQRITDCTSMFSRDRIRSDNKEGNYTLHYFVRFMLFPRTELYCCLKNILSHHKG